MHVLFFVHSARYGPPVAYRRVVLIASVIGMHGVTVVGNY
jgi:hypothetical protein